MKYRIAKGQSDRIDRLTVRSREDLSRILRAYRAMDLIVSYERDHWMGRALTVATPSGFTRVYEYEP